LKKNLNNKKIYLSILGNIKDPNAWSGTGYYCLESFKQMDIDVEGIRLKTNSLNHKLKRYCWNFYSFLKNKNIGGYQYSESSLSFLWNNLNNKFENQILINFFPLFPAKIISNKNISKYFYIDLTLNQFFREYGAPKKMSDSYKKQILEKEYKGFKESKHIFTHSNFVKNDLLNTYNIEEKKISTIMPGANLLNSFKIERKCSFKKLEYLELLFIGKDIYRKGLDRLLEAINKCNEKKTICKLHIVGNKLENDNRFMKYQKMPNIYEYGFIDKKNGINLLKDLLINCDIGILLSRAEAGGMSLREFAFAGMPTISTKVGGIEDHVNKCGSILIDKKNDSEIINEVIKTLKNLYSDQYKLNKLKKSSLKNSSEYSWEFSCAKIISKIKEIE
tara:strand:+ start:754 stop:1923 length:1170 start_codon:yes stop_codon:yes gene_type:complete